MNYDATFSFFPSINVLLKILMQIHATSKDPSQHYEWLLWKLLYPLWALLALLCYFFSIFSIRRDKDREGWLNKILQSMQQRVNRNEEHMNDLDLICLTFYSTFDIWYPFLSCKYFKNLKKSRSIAVFISSLPQSPLNWFVFLRRRLVWPRLQIDTQILFRQLNFKFFFFIFQLNFVTNNSDRISHTTTTWWTRRKTTKNWFGSSKKCWWRNIRCQICSDCQWTSSTTTAAASLRRFWRSSSEKICSAARRKVFTSSRWQARMIRWCLPRGWQSLRAGVAASLNPIPANTSATEKSTRNAMQAKSSTHRCRRKNIPKR